MNEAEFLLWEMQQQRYREQVRLNEHLTEQLTAARALLYSHQWGGSGYCPECAADMDKGHHQGCPWAEAMGDWGAHLQGVAEPNKTPYTAPMTQQELDQHIADLHRVCERLSHCFYQVDEEAEGVRVPPLLAFMVGQILGLRAKTEAAAERSAPTETLPSP